AFICPFFRRFFGSSEATGDAKERYCHRAVQMLNRRLNQPDGLNEGDLFAVSLLAIQARGHGANYIIHAKGFFALRAHLSRSATAKRNTLQVFWPMVRDIMFHKYGPSLHPMINSVKDYQGVNSYKAIQNREEYENLLGGTRVLGLSFS